MRRGRPRNCRCRGTRFTLKHPPCNACPAAESRRPLGVVAVGGMLSSTFLTLLVIPVIYTLFADLAALLGGRRVAAAEPAPRTPDTDTPPAP